MFSVLCKISNNLSYIFISDVKLLVRFKSLHFKNIFKMCLRIDNLKKI